MLNGWRITVLIVLVTFLSGCMGFFNGPDYATLIVESVHETYDGIRVSIENIGGRQGEIIEAVLYAENAEGTVLHSQQPDSLQGDGAWFDNVTLEENPLGGVRQMIEPGTVVRGWAFSGLADVTHVRVYVKWLDNTIVATYEETFPLPFSRGGDDDWYEDDDF